MIKSFFNEKDLQAEIPDSRICQLLQVLSPPCCRSTADGRQNAVQSLQISPAFEVACGSAVDAECHGMLSGQTFFQRQRHDFEFAETSGA